MKPGGQVTYNRMPVINGYVFPEFVFGTHQISEPKFDFSYRDSRYPLNTSFNRWGMAQVAGDRTLTMNAIYRPLTSTTPGQENYTQFRALNQAYSGSNPRLPGWENIGGLRGLCSTYIETDYGIVWPEPGFVKANSFYYDFFPETGDIDANAHIYYQGMITCRDFVEDSYLGFTMDVQLSPPWGIQRVRKEVTVAAANLNVTPSWTNSGDGYTLGNGWTKAVDLTPGGIMYDFRVDGVPSGQVLYIMARYHKWYDRTADKCYPACIVPSGMTGERFSDSRYAFSSTGPDAWRLGSAVNVGAEGEFMRGWGPGNALYEPWPHYTTTGQNPIPPEANGDYGALSLYFASPSTGWSSDLDVVISFKRGVL